MKKPLDVVGIGNAIVDVLSQVEDGFLDERGLVKGTMSLIDSEQAELLHQHMGPPVRVSGGSAANTIAGLVSMGGRGGFIGKVRDDALGKVFTDDIRAAGVEFDTRRADSGPPTGRCVVLISPDAQRTMQTFLGASAHLGPEDIDPYTVSRASVTYLEGYLWDPPPAKQAFIKAARIAHASEGKVALTLSDPFCVKRHRESFVELVTNHIDLLFANEVEATSLFDVDQLDRAVEALRGRCEIAVVTRGAKGSVVIAAGEVSEVAAERVSRPVDSTGAGDLYASGFLYGLTHGHTLVECGRLGSIAGAEVISHVGARPQTSLAELVREKMSRW